MVPARFAPVLDELTPLAARFGAAGHRLYLVGGAVRDLLLGVDHGGDRDLTTAAHPDEVKDLLRGWADAVWTQGERFGTIGARHHRDDGTSLDVEITTFRGERYAEDSRKPDVTFANTIEADLERRDFTVNAMALELGAHDVTLVDPYGGAADLAAARLRTPLSPEVSFDDDPLRMLRAARFIARFGLTPDPPARRRGGRSRRPAGDRVGGADPRRARQADRRRAAVGRPVVPRRYRSRRALPARAAGAAAGARPDPPPQGRPQPHDRRRQQRGAGRLRLPPHPPRRALPRHRQAAHAWLPARQGHDVPPPRRRRGTHDAQADGGAAVPDRRHHRGVRTGLPAPALPHLQDGVERLGGTPLRARRRRPAGRAERADALRLHDA